MNLASIWEEQLQFKFNTLLANHNLELTSDTSDFTVVDGEEGDHGVIKYYDAKKVLVAVRTVEGGDVEHVEFTPYGKLLVLSKLNFIFMELMIEFQKE